MSRTAGHVPWGSLEHPQSICSVLSGLQLRVALSGCIGVSSGYACFALLATLASPPSDCGLCIDECPVNAIFPEEDLPDELQKYLQVNTDWYVQKP